MGEKYGVYWKGKLVEGPFDTEAEAQTFINIKSTEMELGDYTPSELERFLKIKRISNPAVTIDEERRIGVLKRCLKEAGYGTNTKRTALRGKKSKAWVWVRLGDVAEYESFDTLSEAGRRVGLRFLLEKGEPLSVNIVKGGIEIEPVFVGRNYISLYWGDKDAQWIKDLTHTETMGFIRTLRSSLG